ncbi:MAG: hypothetical protein GXO26_07985 [Crenarchaeota archaeon]|nr:hypothetical protein [Thermoproteota archaeon]
MNLEIPAIATTFGTGIAAGYVGTLILEKIGKFILLFLAIVFGGMILFMFWLQSMGFAYIFWSRFIDWLISLIVDFVTFISMHALTPVTGVGTFTVGTLVGAVLRLSRRGTVRGGERRRRMFKLD